MPAGTSAVHEPNVIRVPLGGNSWAKNLADSPDLISEDGLTNWASPTSTVETYVRFARTGTLLLSVNLRVPTGRSRIRITVLGKSKEIDVQGSRFTDCSLGQWSIPKAGYVKLVLQGVSKTGTTYADITDFGISGTTVDEHTAFVRNNDGDFFHWGRRGPSVHLNYPIPDGFDAEWFYNEVTVPKGNDVAGSYYMATGFGEGYFGMQVNSPTERRILFSVWSPFQTDTPSQIPSDQKIRLNRKGANVVTNEFGNEGSGGQSYLRYNWVAGRTYKFLIHGHPDVGDYTTYTAYFMPPDGAGWQLIASFKRPKTTTYLTSLYSFLENFTPETGNVSREVEFSNQWVRSKEGNWQEITKAQFTGDNTARKSYRMDFAGGLSKNKCFFLRNCGFFDAYTPLKTDFTRPAQHQPPTINIDQLP
ncbi:nematoblast specific protein [Spirosoma pollinicola]|uniref:Nematoblast specific protein n=2 Tax=Spirosoma pollinicola TaxID=2057025 RepID=A0A2K8ZCA6_9BACT|nr:nematoblast specific protein [Spirosoma pollinicola]